MKKIILSAFVVAAMFSCINNPEVKVYNGNNRDAILDNMLTRRSIRKYTTQQVSKAQIDTIMKCALYAPSSLNMQPWEVRVVQNPKWLTELNNRFISNAEGKKPDFSVFHNAPTLIVIARDKNNPSSTFDCGLILENILLSAHAIGLGTCAIGSTVGLLNQPENKDLLDILNIPENFEIVITASLGYPNEVPTVKERYQERIKVVE